MTNTSKTILFFGTEEYSLIALSALVEAGYSIGAVITKPDARRGRGQAILEPPVKTYALSHNIPVFQPQKIKDIISDIKQFNTPIGVLVAYGKIIPKSIIELFTPGIINLHPSLLPRYRGPSPIEAAILNRDDKTGISLMQLTSEMDAGPIYHQIDYPLTGKETRPELYETLFTLGTQELIKILPSIISGTQNSVPQSNADATYCPLLSRDDSLIDPQAMTAAEAEAHVRAYLGFPRSRINYADTDVIATKAHIASQQETPLDIKCKDGAFLSIDELVAPSGKTIPVNAFLRGYVR